MLTFENFIMSFVSCKIPDDLLVKEIIIDEKQKLIHVSGTSFDSNGHQMQENHSVPFNEEDLDFKEENNAKQAIVKQ